MTDPVAEPGEKEIQRIRDVRRDWAPFPGTIAIGAAHSSRRESRRAAGPTATARSGIRPDGAEGAAGGADALIVIHDVLTRTIGLRSLVSR
jgi:hypothetical protein